MKTSPLKMLILVFVSFQCCILQAENWAMWGGDLSRNMVSSELKLSTYFSVKTQLSSDSKICCPPGVKWSVRLGSQSYGNPVVSGGIVLVGTNNDRPRNPAYQEDRGVLMCFRERDGRFLWQLAVPKIERTDLFNGDRRHIGICSSPAVEGDRIYVVTNRAEVLCLDAKGLRDGNDGPFRAESMYYAKPLRHAVTYGKKGPRVRFEAGQPGSLHSTDADIIWRFDMIRRVHSWPQDAANSSPLVYGDFVYVTTSNGICNYRKKRTALYPDAPSVIVLNKTTGQLVATDRECIAGRTWHGQWSSPSLGLVNGVPLVFYGGGDGWCYAFDACPAYKNGSKLGTLKTVWKFDCNPLELRFRDGKEIRYKTHGGGPSEIIATPVFYHNRVYVAVGQDPSHGRGKGCLSCIDATQAGDVTDSGRIWTYTGIDRSLSTVAIDDGRLYAADYSGKLHCLDADTGEVLWIHETKSPVWGSPLVADSKVYLGTKRGYLHVLKIGPTEKLLSRVSIGSGIYSTPVAANSVLYVMSSNRLFALVRADNGMESPRHPPTPVTLADALPWPSLSRDAGDD